MNKITDFSDTIVALASGLGSGSIAIIRVSGPKALVIVNNVFVGKDLMQVAPNSIHFGKIEKSEKEIDQVLISVFKAPNSYTGENSVEISCHANPYIVDEIIETLIIQGAKNAKAGEFTLRAFLNGKIDLTQAEAVSDIIQAKSKAGVLNSLHHLNGDLSSKLNVLKKHLIEIISMIEIDLDFSEDNIPISTSADLLKQLAHMKSEVKSLLNSFNYAKILDGSLRMIIAGRPNVGKSTLMNILLGEDRVITSPVAGTTRDMIHENLLIDNIYFKVIDTAGLREAGDHIEIEGIKRTKKQFALADIILLIEDVSEELTQESYSLLKNSDFIDFGKTILVANKTDLGVNNNSVNWLSKFNIPLVKIAAIKDVGINTLKKVIIEKISKGFEKYSDEIVITNLRHKEILEKVLKFIKNAEKGIEKKMGFEFISVDLRAALDSIGEVTGEVVTDDILNNIFSNFCIGK